MQRAIDWLLRNRGPVLACAAAMALAGAWAWTRLPVDAFPDATNQQVMVLTRATGLAAVDVEQRVSFPIEQQLRGLPRVRQVRSLSIPGLSQVVVVFDDEADTYWARQVVFERLADARRDLPPGLDPELGPISTGLGEIFQYTLEGEGRTLEELRTIQDWIVAPRLKPVPGVNEVNSAGGRIKQYQVLVRPDALPKYGLSLDDVIRAVEANNANSGGGVIVRGWEQTYLRGVGLLRDVPDLERIVLKAHEGAPVYLRDVAEVAVGAEPRRSAMTRDGRGEVVAGMVILLKGENSRDVVERVRAAVGRLEGSLPPGVRLSVYYDRTNLIQACVRTVRDALLEGGLMVVLILFLFVAELRTALLVLASLPLTFLAAFVVMGRGGISANLMSLGGLAFSVGMVVDASIVVVENIRRHLAEAPAERPRRDVVAEALAEVARPVSFSVLIIAVILVPLYSLQGIEGKMFEPLATTLLIALLVSLVVALTVAPVLADWLLPRSPAREFGFVRRLHSGYLQLLDRAVRHPRWTATLSVASLAAALAAAPFVGTEFMPPLDEGALAINVVRLPNASVEGDVPVASYLEKRLLRFPEVQTVVTRSGPADISEDPQGPEQSDVFVILKPRGEWGTGRSREELVEAIHQDLAQVPGLRMAFSQPIALRVNELISGVKSDLAVKVFGDDLDLLKKAADQAAAVLRQLPGARDVKVEQVSGMTQYDLEIDRAALARHGINVADVNATLETAVAGRVATTLVEGQRRFGVAVRFPESARRGPDDILRLLVPSPAGARVPLGQLATLREVDAPAQISRENGLRRVVVEVNVRGRDLGGFVSEARERLAPMERTLPAGSFLEFGGQFENQQRAMGQLAIVVPVALALILGLLYLALRSARDSLMVLVNLPFALVGGVLAVVAFGMNLSVSAAVAFIVLLGIAVQNGVVLVATIRQRLEAGRPMQDAVREACDHRFRPLLMTALTSFIGHLPMLYATGSGADIQKPLAVVVMGGLVTSTLLTLLVVPAMYVRWWRAS